MNAHFNSSCNDYDTQIKNVSSFSFIKYCYKNY